MDKKNLLNGQKHMIFRGYFQKVKVEKKEVEKNEVQNKRDKAKTSWRKNGKMTSRNKRWTERR